MASYVEKYELKHRILLDGGEVSAAYGVTRFPTTVWIDRKGMIVDAVVGYGGGKELAEKTASLLRAMKP